MGPRVSVFRISRSRVPGNKSIVIMGCLFPIHLTPSENCATAREDSPEESSPAIIDGNSISHPLSRGNSIARARPGVQWIHQASAEGVVISHSGLPEWVVGA